MAAISPSTVLVVDDDSSIVHLLKEDLEAEGYTVLEGYDGRMALDIASQSLPQLIILDLNMPGIGGVEALEILRKNLATQNIPVLFLTGESSGHLPPELAGMPRVSHLTKPIALESLNSVVRKMISQYPSVPTRPGQTHI